MTLSYLSALSRRGLCRLCRLPAAAGVAGLPRKPSPARLLGNLLATICRACTSLSFLHPGARQPAWLPRHRRHSELPAHRSLHRLSRYHARSLFSCPYPCGSNPPSGAPAALCQPQTGSIILSPDPAHPQRWARERRSMHAMAAQSPAARPSARRSHPPRQVILEYVARRDASQRLSLALSLLVRATGIPGVSAFGPREHPPDAPTMRRPSLSGEEDNHQ